MPLLPAISRLILNILTALSLLLCVAMMALWVRNYHRSDGIAVQDSGGEWGLESASGWTRLSRLRGFRGDGTCWNSSSEGNGIRTGFPSPNSTSTESAFSVGRKVYGPMAWEAWLIYPDPVAVCLFAFLPAVLVARWWRRHRRQVARGFSVETPQP